MLALYFHHKCTKQLCRKQCGIIGQAKVLFILFSVPILDLISQYFHILLRVSDRDAPNIRFVFASLPNSGPNSLFVFGRIVSS